ncbi:MAG: serine hydrolase domain-containing protein [Myxococcota bacterium]|nr:serine hydrolase domain-containing protein [Myxococcota bacterium]
MSPFLVFLTLVACRQDLDVGDDTAGETGGTDVQTWDPRFDELSETLQEDLEASDAAGISVAVMEGGEITYAAVFGSAHPDEEQALSTSTLFQLGSTTKMLTAMALLQQVEADRVGLQDSLATAYPDSDFELDEDWNDQLTLEHLLTHQGGFYDYIDWAASAEDSDLVDWHDDVFFPYLWLMNPPGLFWNYSNPNYNLAGLVAEHHDGQGYVDLMNEDIFVPLGMDRTYQRRSDAEADGDYALGVGYLEGTNDWEYGTVELDDVSDPAHSRPAGSGTWSTPSQVMEVARFLMECDSVILDPAHCEAMTGAQVPLHNASEDWSYGYGLLVGPGTYVEEEYQQVEVWSHNGMTLSYTAEFLVLPEHDFAISVLTSGYGVDLSASLSTAMATLVDLGEPEDEPTYAFDPDRLDDHVGTYDDIYNVGEMVIDRHGDTLVISMPYLEELGYEVWPELYTISDTVFYLSLDEVWYDLTFIGEPGSPSGYVRNRSFVGTRVEDGGDSGDTGSTDSGDTDTSDTGSRSGPPAAPTATPSVAGVPRLDLGQVPLATTLARGRLPSHPQHLPPPPSSED